MSKKGIFVPKCEKCENNAVATHYFYHYINCFFSKNDRVYEKSFSICIKCIEEFKKIGLLPNQEDDVHWGNTISYDGNKELLDFYPFTGEPNQIKNIAGKKAYPGVNLVVPFGNEVDDKTRPIINASRSQRWLSVQFSGYTKEVLRTPEIRFFQ